MSAIKLSSRYAKSLLDFAIEKGKVDEIYQDQLFLQKILKESREFRKFLSSPIINPDKKFRALSIIIEGKVSDFTITFLKLLVKKHREVFLQEVTDSFIQLYNEHKRITNVKIISAAPLDNKDIERMLEKLKKEANLENINLETEVDEELIGGFVLQYKDKLYDASIARSLDLIKREFDDNEYLKKLR